MSCLPEELVTWQILPLASSKTTANKTCGGLVTTLPSEFRLITNLNMATANRTRPTDYRHVLLLLLPLISQAHHFEHYWRCCPTYRVQRHRDLLRQEIRGEFLSQGNYAAGIRTTDPLVKSRRFYP